MSTIEQASGRKQSLVTHLAGGFTWSEAVLVGGFAGLASVLPLIVTTRWYDYYYWPKVQVLYAAVVLLTAVALLTRRDRWLLSLRSPAGIALSAWLAAVAVSTAASVNPLLSLVGEDYRYEGLLTWLAYGAVVAGVAATFSTARRIRLLLGMVFAASGVMAVLGLLQHFGWTPVPEDVIRTGLWTRAWGTTGNPLALGAYLALLLPVLISLYAGEIVPWRRRGYGGLAVFLYAALVATLSRAAWGGLALGVVVWASASDRERLRTAAGPLLLLVVACAAVTLAVTRTGPPPLSSHSGHPANRQTSAEQRTVLWRTVAPLVAKRPLLGWGPETLAQVYPAYGTPEFLRVFPEAAMQHVYVDRPHNDLMQQAVSTGLVGLAAYIWMWSALFKTAWRAARAAAPDTLAARLTGGLLGGFAAYAFQLQFSFSYVSVAPVFWSLVGLLLVISGDPSSK